MISCKSVEMMTESYKLVSRSMAFFGSFIIECTGGRGGGLIYFQNSPKRGTQPIRKIFQGDLSIHRFFVLNLYKHVMVQN